MIECLIFCNLKFDCQNDPLCKGSEKILERSRNLEPMELESLRKLNLKIKPRKEITVVEKMMPEVSVPFYLRQKEFVDSEKKPTKIGLSKIHFFSEIFFKKIHSMPSDGKGNKTSWSIPADRGNFSFIFSQPKTIKCFSIANDVQRKCLPDKFQLDLFSAEREHYVSHQFQYMLNNTQHFFKVDPPFQPIGFRFMINSNHKDHESCLSGLSVFPTC